MNVRKLMSRTLSILVVASLFSIFAFADTIRLKDGSTIKGKITSFSGGKFTITMGEGTRKRELTFDADEIESIIFDRVDQPVRAAETVAQNIKLEDPPLDKKHEVIIKDPVPIPQPKTNTPVNSTSSRSPIQPLVINVTVLADNTANGWTNSGWVVKRGQRIRITGEGEVSLGKGRKSGPSGLYDLEDSGKLLKSVPTGALIAVVGDDNNDFIYIGSDREFVAQRDGTLFLGLNEGNLNDNSGSFKVKVEVSPGS